MTRLTFPTFSLDPETELLEVDGSEIRLRPKTWNVLLHLAYNPGRIVTKEELLNEVWRDVTVTDDMPRICVGELRAALGDSPRASSIIETVHGRGYRLLVQPESDRSSNKPSLAVFPFATSGPSDNSGTGESEGLGSFLNESLTDALGEHEELNVAGTFSVNAAIRRQTTLEAQARSLGVRHILKGSVDYPSPSNRADSTNGTDNNVLVTAELFDVEKRQVIWQRVFGRPVGELVELQQHLAEEVAEALRDEQQPAPSGTLRLLQKPSNATAYHLYLRGLRLQNRFDPESWSKAAQCHRMAIDIDPSFAPPWTGLARVALLRSEAGLGNSQALGAEAEAHSRKALELDSDLPEAHCTLGDVELRHRWNFAEAERRLKTAIALRPSFAMAYYSLQRLLWYSARFDDAREAGDRAYELDPLSPVLQANRGFGETLARNHESAIQLFDAALEDDPQNLLAAIGRGAALRNLGRWAEAIAQFEACRDRVKSPWIPALIAHAQALAGNRAAARTGLRALEEGAAREVDERSAPVPNTLPSTVPRTHLAMILGALDENTAAFERLDEALKEREESLLSIVDPAFDPLRTDSRFLELVQSVGLPDAVAAVPKDDHPD